MKIRKWWDGLSWQKQFDVGVWVLILFFVVLSTVLWWLGHIEKPPPKYIPGHCYQYHEFHSKGTRSWFTEVKCPEHLEVNADG